MSREEQNLGWVAQARQESPLLSDARRERLQARFVNAVRHRDTNVPFSPGLLRPGLLRPIMGLAFATAAAVLVFVLWRPVPQVLSGMQVSGAPGGLREDGWFAQGEVLETFNRSATLRFGQSSIDVKPHSQVVSRVVSKRRIVQRLARGEVVVAYHPEKDLQQKLSIETDSALVDVVGTRFSVRAVGSQTDVHVFEGVVRVTPQSGEPARLLRAGQSATVRDKRFADLRVAPAQPWRVGTSTPRVETQVAAEFQARTTEPTVYEREAREQRAPKARPSGNPDSQVPSSTRANRTRSADAGEKVPTPAFPDNPTPALADKEASVGDQAAVADDFVLEVPGAEGLDPSLSVEELEQAQDEDFAKEVRKDPASTLDRVATLTAPERQRHLLYRFVRQVRSAEHLGAAWTMVAESWRKQGLPRRALEGYRRARRAGRGTAWERHALFESGLLHRSLGEDQKFRAALESYLELAPDGFRAMQARQLLCDDGHCPKQP